MHRGAQQWRAVARDFDVRRFLARPRKVMRMRSQQRQGAERRHACGVKREQPLRDLILRRGGFRVIDVRNESCEAAGFGASQVAADAVVQLGANPAALRCQKCPIRGGAELRHRRREFMILSGRVSEDDAPHHAEPGVRKAIPCELAAPKAPGLRADHFHEGRGHAVHRVIRFERFLVESPPRKGPAP